MKIIEDFAALTGAHRVNLKAWNPTTCVASFERETSAWDGDPTIAVLTDESGSLGCIEHWGSLESRPGADNAVAAARAYLSRSIAAQRRDELHQFLNGLLHDVRGSLRRMATMAPLFDEAGFDRQTLRSIFDGEAKGFDSLLRQAQVFTDNLSPDRCEQCTLRNAWDRAEYEYTKTHVGAELEGTVEIPPDLSVAVYEPRISNVFYQLIDNTFKFGPRPARISILSERSFGGGVGVVYRDNGAGLDPQYLSKLFTPFFRGHGAQYEGQGLGLFLCRQIIRHAGGKIEVAVKSSSGGLEFEIWLPS